MILTNEQKGALQAAVDRTISPVYDPTLITIYRTSNKHLQVFYVFGEEAHYVSQICGMSFSRKAEFPWSLGYISFASQGYAMLQQKIPVGMQVDIIYF